MAIADLLRGARADQQPDDEPSVMAGEVREIVGTTLRVVVPAIDNGTYLHEPFGTYPDAEVGDEVRVTRDEYGELVIVAWEPA